MSTLTFLLAVFWILKKAHLESFVNLNTLMYLITGNLDLRHFQILTHNLKDTSIKTLRANGINCLTGMGTMILKRHLENLKHTNISEIYFEKNRLEQLEPQALRLLPINLTLISFGENKLTTGRYLIDFSFLQNIRVYNMSLQLRPPPYPESIFDTCKEKSDVLAAKFDVSGTKRAPLSFLPSKSWNLNWTII